MDSRDNFTLKINGNYYGTGHQEIDVTEDCNIKVEFKSDNPNARFYLNLLDLVPNCEPVDIKVDNGLFYINPTNNAFYIYKNEQGYKPLFPGQFPFIIVMGKNRIYKGFLNIKLKLLEIGEWKKIKDDLEKEIIGLSREYYRTLIGPNNHQLSPEVLRPYLIIQKNYKRILGALYNIQKNPHYVIKSENNEKILDYDIQDNKILKSIINLYENLLSVFIDCIEHSANHNLNKFKERAIKLKKVTSLVKGQEWYKSVEEPTSNFIPHSLALDPCYSILYKLYRDLTFNNNKIIFNTNFPWKQTSLIYEMWSYIKLCRELQKLCLKSDLAFKFNEKDLFPFLKSGSTSVFYFDSFKFEVIYDYEIGERKTSDFPIYTKQSHNKPDIIINVYSDKFSRDDVEVYIGTFIIECKYRSFQNYWDSASGNARMQIYSYKNGLKSSELLYEDIDSNPVKGIFVLTPDEEVKQFDFSNDPDNIEHLCLRDQKSFDYIIGMIFHEAIKLFKKYRNHITRLKEELFKNN